MSLAATLAASGMRPASFLPTVKCSSCGHEIEISAMGHHECTSVPPSPTVPSAPTIDPYISRQTDTNETGSVQPSTQNLDPEQQLQRQQTAGALDNQHRAPKASRPGLPKINATIANQPFLSPAQAPISPALSNRSGSSEGSKRTRKRRSATNPTPLILDPRPPTPELTGNLDCAFPPFPNTPVTSSRRPSTASRCSRDSKDGAEVQGVGRQVDYTNNTLDRLSPPRNFDSAERLQRSSYEIMSQAMHRPQTQQAEGLTPFEHYPLPTSPLSYSSSDNPDQVHQPMSLFPPLERPSLVRRTSEEKSKTNGNGLRSISGTIRSALSRKPSERRLSRKSQITRDVAPPSMPETQWPPGQNQPSQRKTPPQRPARPEEGLPSDLLHSFNQGESSNQGWYPPPIRLQEADRSQTLPILHRQPDDEMPPATITKMPSEPVLLPEGSCNTAVTTESHSVNQVIVDPQKHYHREDEPPVPRPVQQLNRPDSFHKSSESDTSTASTALSLSNFSTGNSNSTSRTSPMWSTTSSFNASLPFTSEPDSIENDDDHDGGAQNARLPQRATTKIQLAEHELLSKMDACLPAVHIDERHHKLPLRSLDTAQTSRKGLPESQMDPAQHEDQFDDDERSSRSASPSDGLRLVIPTNASKHQRLLSDAYKSMQPTSPARDSDQLTQSRPASRASKPSDFQGFNFEMSPASPERAGSPHEDSMDSFVPPSPHNDFIVPPLSPVKLVDTPLSPLPLSSESLHPPVSDRRPSRTKPICRGCSEQIEGKSVKAADGRLTGRWHRACFLCQTCRLPFDTADFYVINNLPYCEQHYHEKNGSICHGCRAGIEGHFLEARSGPSGKLVRKYHPYCFTCVECRVVLTDEYFEIAGRVHCERHAQAAMRLQHHGPPPPSPGFPRAGSRLRAESFGPQKQRTMLMQK